MLGKDQSENMFSLMVAEAICVLIIFFQSRKAYIDVFLLRIKDPCTFSTPAAVFYRTFFYILLLMCLYLGGT